MSDLEGARLLHAVVVRIIARYLQSSGHVDVRVSSSPGRRPVAITSTSRT